MRLPNLTLAGTHTGYPWVDEMIAVAIKWPKVFLSVSAWFPKYFTPSLVSFMNHRVGAGKVLFGSNGLDWNRYWKGFHEMKLRDDTLKAVCTTTQSGCSASSGDHRAGANARRSPSG